MTDSKHLKEADALMDRILTEENFNEERAVERFVEETEDRPDLLKAICDNLGFTEYAMKSFVMKKVEDDPNTPPGSTSIS